jgi:hypothetical protein
MGRSRTSLIQIVAVERDVKPSMWRCDALELTNQTGDSAGERQAACTDTDKDEVLRTSVALDKLVTHPGQRPPNVLTRHDDSGALSLRFSGHTTASHPLRT